MLLPPTFFPFVIPWDGSLKGTAVDVSFLNAAPAGSGGRIVAKGGHFVEANTGRRVRFMGANLTALAAFPTHADADRIAARLATLGFNIVRFHHLQATWAIDQGGSIWKKGRENVEVDPAQLDKLDYFVAALKRRGVYSNLNLQTTREYVPELGFPEEVRQLKDYAKRIDKVDRRMIALQKAYAKTLLDRKNPYTGLAYRDEPALAVVEINNENSLVGTPWGGMGKGLGDLPPYFRDEVRTAWNAWLRKTYRDDAGLRAAWSKGTTLDGPPFRLGGWSEENQSHGDVRPVLLPVPKAASGTLPIARDVRSNPGPDWHVQLHQNGLDLKEGDTYTVTFSASCSNPADIRVDASLDEADWHNVGLAQTIHLESAAKPFRLTFVAHDVRKDHDRLAFAIGAARGVVAITNLEIRPGLGGPAAFPPLGEVPLYDGGPAPEARDWIRFLADAETAYADEMRGYLRKDLGIRANLIDSQIQWGGLTALQREAGSDFADAHFYWEHPAFPHRSWDMADWTVRNTSMADAIARADTEVQLGTGLVELARHRVEGKPFTVSEVNEPAPNEFRAELMPLLAAFAADQDWDGFYLFEYGVTGTGRANDRFDSFFDTALDPVKAAFFPSAALIFRGAEVPAQGATMTMRVPATRPYEAAPEASAAWRGKGYSPFAYRSALAPDLPTSEVKERLRWQGAKGNSLIQPHLYVSDLRPRPGIDGSRPPGMGAPANDPTAKLYATDAPAGSGIQFDAPAAQGGAGFFGGHGVDSLLLPIQGDRFAAYTLVALDRKPLATSAHALLTLANRAENVGMGWNAARTSVGDAWGKGPVMAEGLAATIMVPSSTLRAVWALDSRGRRTVKVPTSVYNRQLVFRPDPKYRTLWYEIAAK